MTITILPVVFILLLFTSSCQPDDDQLTQAKPLSYGDKLVSRNGVFALGFFSTNSNTTFYIGIWYNNIPDPHHPRAWVANRDSPVTTPSSAKLAITDNQALALSLSDGSATATPPLWSTPPSSTDHDAIGATAPTAVLLDSGNFVLRSPNGTTIWQSFDHPSATILPTMKVLLSYKGSVATTILACRSSDDMSPGDFSGSIDPTSNLQFFVRKSNQQPYYRISFFDEVSMFGFGSSSSTTTTTTNATSVVQPSVNNTGDEFYYTFTVSDGSPFTRILLQHDGNMSLWTWNNLTSKIWIQSFKRPSSGCDLYASCGPFGYCDHTEAVPSCRCLDGFESVDGLDISRGCRRNEALAVCGTGTEDRFVALPGMMVPDNFLQIRNRTFEQCAAECSTNCSCTAYAYVNVSSAAGTLFDTLRCLVWTGDLIDTGKTASSGQNLYLRLAGSHVLAVQHKRISLKILIPIIACMLLLPSIALFWICKYRGRQQKKKNEKRKMLEYLRSTNEAAENLEFPLISFEDIVAATDNFSDSNVLGKGGFGKVYKGVLQGAKEVAVKRLSKGSGQGTEEFRNEVVLIANLQHKNLVKLHGCCIHQDERLLVYEYLPNKSLDCFIFDSARKYMLQWPTRCRIIQGIARGILYLHQDSRLTIIHRDLKASNVLLDKEMSPKISDFGMARIFSGNQLEANTNRLAGTYGYMSPEYVTEGAFSVKSDTYSFGVLLLEIVSGLKISSPHLIVGFSNLIEYAWNLWRDGNIENFVDSSLKESCSLDEAARCIHIGLLCVQDNPSCRPLMSEVVFMLENKTTTLLSPRKPVCFLCRDPQPEKTGDNKESSVNGMSVTTLGGR